MHPFGHFSLINWGCWRIGGTPAVQTPHQVERHVCRANVAHRHVCPVFRAVGGRLSRRGPDLPTVIERFCRNFEVRSNSNVGNVAHVDRTSFPMYPDTADKSAPTASVDFAANE